MGNSLQLKSILWDHFNSSRLAKWYRAKGISIIKSRLHWRQYNSEPSRCTRPGLCTYSKINCIREIMRARFEATQPQRTIHRWLHVHGTLPSTFKGVTKYIKEARRRILPKNLLKLSSLGEKRTFSNISPPEQPRTFTIAVFNRWCRNTCNL